MRAQIWLGVGSGFLICMIIAAALIGVFYTVGGNSWETNEHYYEGAFCLVASLIITVMGVALLRIGKMQEKWRVKLARSLEAPLKAGSRRRWLGRFFEKYAMFALPFITVLREGIEAVVFVAGVSFSAPAYAVPLPVVVGLLVGGFVGWLLYKGGSTAKLQIFLVASTCLLYLVSAGLFSRAVWNFEAQKWNEAVGGDATETGSGAGSYDIDKSVWHVNVRPTSSSHLRSSSPRPNAMFVPSLTRPKVLPAKRRHRRRLGHLQRHPRLDQLGHLRVRHLVQPVLALCHLHVCRAALQGDQGPLAPHEGQSRPLAR